MSGQIAAGSILSRVKLLASRSAGKMREEA